MATDNRTLCVVRLSGLLTKLTGWYILSATRLALRGQDHNKNRGILHAYSSASATRLSLDPLFQSGSTFQPLRFDPLAAHAVCGLIAPMGCRRSTSLGVLQDDKNRRSVFQAAQATDCVVHGRDDRAGVRQCGAALCLQLWHQCVGGAVALVLRLDDISRCPGGAQGPCSPGHGQPGQALAAGRQAYMPGHQSSFDVVHLLADFQWQLATGRDQPECSCPGVRIVHGAVLWGRPGVWRQCRSDPALRALPGAVRQAGRRRVGDGQGQRRRGDHP